MLQQSQIIYFTDSIWKVEWGLASKTFFACFFTKSAVYLKQVMPNFDFFCRLISAREKGFDAKIMENNIFP